MSLSSSALLMKLNTNYMDVKVKRADVSQQTAINEGTDERALIFKEDILQYMPEVKNLNKYLAKCRARHAELTLPWEDRGFRLLATSLFMDYNAEFKKYKQEFLDMRQHAYDNYHRILQKAIAASNHKYAAEHFPSQEDILNKFDMEYIPSPVPESGHLALDIPKQELDELRESMESEFADRFTVANKQAWDKLFKMLSDMSNKLTEADEDTKKRFHDSFLENAKDLCKLLTHLNISNDPDLERARKQLEDALVGADIEMIKESPATREVIKSKVDSILSQFDF